MATDTAHVHMQLLGAPRSFELTIPTGAVALEELLPVARELANKVVVLAIDAVGGKVSCGPGCGACCRQQVTVTVVEARRLAMLVANMPEPRQAIIRRRFLEAIQRLEHSGLLGPAGRRCWRSSESGEAGRDEVAARYFELGIPCPFLEEDSCSIHPERPLVCREYLVTSAPSHCAKYLAEPVDMVPCLGVTRALGRACRKLNPTNIEGVPMLLALEYSEELGDKLDTLVDGVEAFRAFLAELGETRERVSTADDLSSPRLD